MSFARILPLALALTAPVFAQDQTKHLLRFRFKPDHVWHTSIKQEMSMAMNMGAQDMSTKMVMEMFASNKVNKVEGNKAELEQEITRIKVKMDNPMMAVDYDSDDPDSDPGMLRDLEDMVGSKSGMVISDTGKLSDVKLAEELTQNARAAGMDMKQMMSQSVIELPEKPIAIGETWTVEQDIPMGQMGATKAQSTNKLVAVDGDFFVIEQTVKVDTSEMEIPGGMELEDMTMKGTNKIDRRTGMSHELDMNMKMKMSGQMSMTMDMKMSMRPAPAPQKKAEKKAEAGK